MTTESGNPRGCILVTGASSGIGRSIAKRLSARQPVILHGRDEGRLASAVADCVGSNCVQWSCDLQRVDSIGENLSSFLRTNNLVVEAFVHSAGIVGACAARSIDVVALQRVMSVNYSAALLIVSCLLSKRINAAALRNVVFVSSIWSKFGARGHAIYCGSKAALDGSMRALAVELAPSVRVNSLVLGAIETPLAHGALGDEKIRSKLADDYPLGVGIPAHAADATEFLLSEKAAWITGQQFVVDGGRTANMSLK